jgi:microcin C transport system substrate-binding protein
MTRALKRLGITARVRTVESAQYVNRVKKYDFDCIVSVWGMSLCPGNEQFENWSTQAADTEGARNYAGIKSHAIDDLLGRLIEARTREELRAYARALDRMLQWGFYIIPAWGGGDDRIAYWDKFDYPHLDYVPIQGVSDVMMWWVDKQKADSLARRVKEMKRH